MFEIEKTLLDNVYKLHHPVFLDERGSFVKTFHESTFQKYNLSCTWKENFYSYSKNNVLRGMHYQKKPHEQYKMISCLDGEVLDVLLDLRTDSKTYGKCESFILKSGISIYIPPLVAHGFLVTTNSALLHYQVSQEYSPDHDTGVLWNSIPFEWPSSNPVISKRDLKLPAFVSTK